MNKTNTNPGYNLLVNIALALLSTVLIVFLIELVFYLLPTNSKTRDPLHLLGHNISSMPYYDVDDYLFWKITPNIILPGKDTTTPRHYIPINNLGFRGLPYDPADYNDHKRIVCLGDSCTFGWQVSFGNAYPEILESMLNQSSTLPHYKTINLAVPSYTSFQMERVFRKWDTYFKPYLIVLWAGTNDVSFAFQLPDSEMAKRYEKGMLIKSIVSNSYSLSYIDNWLYEKRYGKQTVETAVKQAQKRNVRRVSLSESRTNIINIINRCKQDGVKIILVTRQNYTLRPALDDYNDMLLELGKTYQIPVVDIAKMATGPAHRDLYFDPDNDVIHLNTKGNQLVANEILKVMKANNLLQ